MDKPTPSEVRETGWLIERSGQWYAAAPHTSWTIRRAVADLNRENWTHDAAGALRFARKIDAETLIQFVGWQNATATEHVFLGNADFGPADKALEAEVARLRLLLTDLKKASASVEADWAEFGEITDGQGYAWWNDCIDAASGYLAKDGPDPINETALNPSHETSPPTEGGEP